MALGGFTQQVAETVQHGVASLADWRIHPFVSFGIGMLLAVAAMAILMESFNSARKIILVAVVTAEAQQSRAERKTSSEEEMI